MTVKYSRDDFYVFNVRFGLMTMLVSGDYCLLADAGTMNSCSDSEINKSLSSIASFMPEHKWLLVSHFHKDHIHLINSVGKDYERIILRDSFGLRAYNLLMYAALRTLPRYSNEYIVAEALFSCLFSMNWASKCSTIQFVREGDTFELNGRDYVVMSPADNQLMKNEETCRSMLEYLSETNKELAKELDVVDSLMRQYQELITGMNHEEGRKMAFFENYNLRLLRERFARLVDDKEQLEIKKEDKDRIKQALNLKGREHELCISFKEKGDKLWFTGDIEIDEMNRCLNNYHKDTQISVFIAPHHGTGSHLSSEIMCRSRFIENLVVSHSFHNIHYGGIDKAYSKIGIKRFCTNSDSCVFIKDCHGKKPCDGGTCDFTHYNLKY